MNCCSKDCGLSPPLSFPRLLSSVTCILIPVFNLEDILSQSSLVRAVTLWWSGEDWVGSCLLSPLSHFFYLHSKGPYQPSLFSYSLSSSSPGSALYCAFLFYFFYDYVNSGPPLLSRWKLAAHISVWICLAFQVYEKSGEHMFSDSIIQQEKSLHTNHKIPWLLGLSAAVCLIQCRCNI